MHAYDPNTKEAEAKDKKFEASLGYMWIIG